MKSWQEHIEAAEVALDKAESTTTMQPSAGRHLEVAREHLAIAYFLTEGARTRLPEEPPEQPGD